MGCNFITIDDHNFHKAFKNILNKNFDYFDEQVMLANQIF